MKKQISYEEVLMNLKQKGVQFSTTRAPYGKQENTSMMIGRYQPIIIPKKKD